MQNFDGDLPLTTRLTDVLPTLTLSHVLEPQAPVFGYRQMNGLGTASFHCVEALGCWCGPWTSNPVLRVKPPVGGFDSHTPPPPAKFVLGRINAETKGRSGVGSAASDASFSGRGA